MAQIMHYKVYEHYKRTVEYLNAKQEIKWYSNNFNK